MLNVGDIVELEGWLVIIDYKPLLMPENYSETYEAGARTLIQITSYSYHALEQFAGRDGGISVSQSVLSDAWSSPPKVEYVPSECGPIFRSTGRMQS